MNYLRRLHLIGCLVAGVLIVPSLQAAIVHLPGTTVDFYYDDTQPGMAVYGTLNAVGDSIFSTPTGFFAEAANVGGNHNLPITGTVTVVAKAGYQFDLVQVVQQGDYIRNGTGASVSVLSDLDVTDSGNASTTVNSLLTSSSDFTLQGTNNWSSGVTVNLDTPMWSGVTSIDLELDTLLAAATTNNGELARIENKLTGGGLVTIMTMPVPLPPSLWLFAGGLAVLLRKGRG